MDSTLIKDTSKSLTNGRCKSASVLDNCTHYHKQTELIYVMKGCIKVLFSNKVFSLKQGDYTIIKSLEAHSILPFEKSSKVMLIILPDIFSENLTKQSIASRIFTEHNEDLYRIIKMYSQFKWLGESYFYVYYRLVYEAIKNLSAQSRKMVCR
jgi:hypothetical protein